MVVRGSIWVFGGVARLWFFCLIICGFGDVV